MSYRLSYVLSMCGPCCRVRRVVSAVLSPVARLSCVGGVACSAWCWCVVCVVARCKRNIAAIHVIRSGGATTHPILKYGSLPLHLAARFKALEAVVKLLVDAYPDAAKEKDNVRRHPPSLLHA